MKSKVLGRGLDALFGEIDEAYVNESTTQENLLDLDLSEIKPNPYQPRKEFEESSLRELSDSIKNDGLIQPIIVTEDIDGYIIIAGERRFRASKLANLKTIKSIIIKIDDYKMREFALVENIQREDLNSIELAFAYNELIKLHNITHEELSSVIHKSRTHITNTIRLLQLSKNTQNSIIDKKITTGHAKVLVGLDEKKQKTIVDTIIGQKLSVRDVETLVKTMKQDTNILEKPDNNVVLDLSQIVDKIKESGFRSKASKNKLIIEFSDDNEVENFLSYFLK